MAVRKRQTVKVQEVKERVNAMIKAHAHNAPENDQFRMGMAAVLETILHESGQYKGFNYNEWLEGGFTKWREDGEPGFPEKEKYLGDQTNRTYH